MKRKDGQTLKPIIFSRRERSRGTSFTGFVDNWGSMSVKLVRGETIEGSSRCSGRTVTDKSPRLAQASLFNNVSKDSAW